jgi:hypothetical protein
VAVADAINSVRAGDRSLVNCKDYGVALLQRHYLDSALPSRALLGQHELTAVEARTI